jgi:hypothetical protein
MTLHQVWRSGDSWYADVQLPSVHSYAPFVRLTVARFQPNSLSGLSLSAPVDTDIVQVLPDRTLTVQRQGDALTVALGGTRPDGPRQNRVDVLMEHGSSDAALLAGLDGDQAPAWQRVPGASVSGPLNTALPPLAIPHTDDLLRIYVREVEQPATSPSGGDWPNASSSPTTYFSSRCDAEWYHDHEIGGGQWIFQTICSRRCRTRNGTC